MTHDLDHLPHWKQIEIERICAIILEEFEDALAGSKREEQGKASILKIILFGSHARGDWVNEVHTRVGRHSDYDILIVVNDDTLTDYMKYWSVLGRKLRLENTILHRLLSPVQFIVHSMNQINDMLKHGRYFMIDIIKEGIAIYESDNVSFSDPVEKTPSMALSTARDYYTRFMFKSKSFWKTYNFAMADGIYENASFQLHQFIERLYNTVLLTCTFYTPYSHNLTKLRGFAEGIRPELSSAWPRSNSMEVDAFEKLQEAYVNARYDKGFEIELETLSWLGDRAELLMNMVESACEERINELEKIEASSN